MIKLLLPALLLVAIVLAGICLDAPAPRAEFTFVTRGEVSTLDPVQMSWLQDFRCAGLLYEGLTRLDTSTPDLRVAPGVASAWTVSPDGREYTFTLDAAAYWSNGEPVRAGDFVYAWRRVILPDAGGDYAKLLSCIRGVDAFVAWRAQAVRAFAADPARRGSAAAAESLWTETLEQFDRLVGLEAPDDRTLRVILTRPTPYFLDLTSFGALYPVFPSLVQAYESVDAQSGVQRTDPGWLKPGVLVGNGPFVLAAWRFMREMRFEPNPHYRDAGGVTLDSVACLSIRDGNAQVLAFRTGAVDWTTDVMPAYRGEVFAAKREFRTAHALDVERLTAAGAGEIDIDRALPRDPRAHAHAFPAFGTYFYNFNARPRLADGTPNPFAIPAVRRAFARTIDRRGVCEGILRAGETPAATLIPPRSIVGYASPTGLDPDPALAREELREAGYPEGRGFPMVEILVNAEGDHALIAQSIARDWERTLGVRTRVLRKETRAFREDVKSGRFMISRASWFGDYADPTTFLEINRTGDGNNDRGYSSPAFDALLDAAAQERDPESRMILLARAERLLIEDDAALAPIYQYVQQYLFDPHRLEGISTHPHSWQDVGRFRVRLNEATSEHRVP
ncbi:MAG: peptide ABC transporter substrate-binding protein [Phycisphaerae bacterium]|nr:MAG: peptide ABC transporter substrate-binding protein [Phycisphaerae bacterium]